MSRSHAHHLRPRTRVGRSLGVVGLGLVILSATDSIRNLPTTATFGWAAIFMYGIAVVAFLIPVAFTSAELATAWPGDGGVYSWVTEAFGSKWGFLAVWCDWSENVVWFPTVLLFLATTTAYVFDPSLATNKAFLVTVMLAIFWGATLFAFAGSLKSARWTGILSFVGTAVPTALIIVLGGWWLGSGRKSQIPYHPYKLLPPWHGLQSLVYVAGIVVAFAGMEIGGYYAKDTRNPKRTFPLSVLGAAVIVATLSILGSLAIAVVVPRDQVNLAGGVMQALTTFFDELGVSWAVKPVGVLILVGVIGSLTAWAVGPALGMRNVSQEGNIAAWWGRSNRRDAPVAVLLLQACLATAITLLMLFVNSINTFYWMLTALVAQTFVVMYLLMYLAVLRLRKTQPDTPRAFRVPGGTFGLWFFVGLGIAGALFTLVLGFIPADHLSISQTQIYVIMMVLGFATIMITPFLLHRSHPRAGARPRSGSTGPAPIRPSRPDVTPPVPPQIPSADEILDQ